jgi:hypothetical protein
MVLFGFVLRSCATLVMERLRFAVQHAEAARCREGQAIPV